MTVESDVESSDWQASNSTEKLSFMDTLKLNSIGSLSFLRVSADTYINSKESVGYSQTQCPGV
jgi:hypothetical protein